MPLCRATLALCAFVVFAPVAHAQDEPTPPDTTEAVPLPPVTIEAARATASAAEAPFAVSLRRRDAADVRLTPAFSLNAVLGDLPGVNVSNRSHFALGERLSVRGLGYRAQFGVRGVQVLLNGVPLTQPDGQATLDVVEPATLRQVELVRGLSSRFWGNGAGGVLFLSTAQPSEQPFARVRAMGGSYGRRHLLAEGGAAVGAHYVQGFAGEARRDGFRDHSEGRRARAGLNGRFRLGEHTTLRAAGAFSNQDTENPSSLTREQLRAGRDQARPAFVQVGAGKRSTQGQLGLTLEHRAGVGTITAAAYGLFRDLENPLSFGFIDLDRRTAGGRLAFEPALDDVLGDALGERLHVSFSADAGYQHDQRTEYAGTTDGAPADSVTLDSGPQAGARVGSVNLDQLETVVTLGAGAFARYDVTSALQLSAGARLSRVRFENDDALIETPFRAARGDQSGGRTFSALSPSLGISYRVGPAVLFANYNTAFETPTTTELTGRPDLGGGFKDDLAPQRARGVESGARGALPSARLDFDVALFYLRVDDALVQTGQNAAGRAFFGNVGQSLHRGIEAALSWQALAPRAGDPLGLELALRYDGGRYTFGEDVTRDGETLRTEGNRLPGLPTHRFFARAAPALPGGGWGEITFEAASDAYVDDANTATTDDYAGVDVRVGHRKVALPVGGAAGELRLQPFAAVKNVFDTEYNGSIVPNAFGGRYYEPAPGRHFALGVNVAW